MSPFATLVVVTLWSVFCVVGCYIVGFYAGLRFEREQQLKQRRNLELAAALAAQKPARGNHD